MACVVKAQKAAEDRSEKEKKEEIEQQKELPRHQAQDQKKEAEQTKEVGQKKVVERKQKVVERKQRKVDNLFKEKREVKEDHHLKGALDTKTKKQQDQTQSTIYARNHYEDERWVKYDRYEDRGFLDYYQDHLDNRDYHDYYRRHDRYGSGGSK